MSEKKGIDYSEYMIAADSNTKTITKELRNYENQPWSFDSRNKLEDNVTTSEITTETYSDGHNNQPI